ncbi:hypothetical protein NDU88_000105 [Pleurodeles waltl]|uniref:Uncharacterized protein n=1 Tax=Pleurodeles waltl TaxID=8319 RepID=A0AAV7VSI1_PLEWA|nr:hypothetical protein NDU88_000105 [Pleurodeles waltl]
MEVAYHSGARNQSDFLLRRPLQLAEENMTADEVVEEYVRVLVLSACPRAINLKEISDAAPDVAVLAKVRRAFPYMVTPGNIFIKMAMPGQPRTKTD